MASEKGEYKLNHLEEESRTLEEQSKRLEEQRINIESKRLEEQSKRLEEELMNIKQKRYELKNNIKAFRADMGCECDANFCKTERNNELINNGEVDDYCHDDQDIGRVSVRCLSGEMEVKLYTAIWSDYVELDSKRLVAGQRWDRSIPEQSWWYDQTNRVEIIGRMDNTRYSLDFRSWDN